MNRLGTMVGAMMLAALGLAAIDSVLAADPAVKPPLETEFRRDTGPAAGPAREAGLERLGQLRLRRSEEINGSRWGVSCHWIADEHPLEIEQRLEHLSALGVKWAFLVPDWDRIEREKGRYDWNTSSHRLDDVVTGLARRKITPVIQIYGGNRLYMPAGADPEQTATGGRRQDCSTTPRFGRPGIAFWRRWCAATSRT